MGGKMEGLNIGLAEDSSSKRCWRGFEGRRWQRSLDVRDFIVRNLRTYEGDDSFRVGPSPRTQAVWPKLQLLFREAQRKGVLDVDATTPSTMLAHATGWIDRDNEVI